MIQKDSEYIRGSTARQLQWDSTARQLEQDSAAVEFEQDSVARQTEYDVYEENRVLKAKKQYKSNRKLKFKMVVAIMAVLVASLTVMWRYAIITKISYEINERESDFSKLRNENAIMRVQIETTTNLTEVKEVAENKLGMQMPSKSQIVYVRIPRNDYTVLVETQDETTDDSSVFKAVLNKAQGLTKLFE